MAVLSRGWHGGEGLPNAIMIPATDELPVARGKDVVLANYPKMTRTIATGFSNLIESIGSLNSTLGQLGIGVIEVKEWERALSDLTSAVTSVDSDLRGVSSRAIQEILALLVDPPLTAVGRDRVPAFLSSILKWLLQPNAFDGAAASINAIDNAPGIPVLIGWQNTVATTVTITLEGGCRWVPRAHGLPNFTDCVDDGCQGTCDIAAAAIHGTGLGVCDPITCNCICVINLPWWMLLLWLVLAAIIALIIAAALAEIIAAVQALLLAFPEFAAAILAWLKRLWDMLHPGQRQPIWPTFG